MILYMCNMRSSSYFRIAFANQHQLESQYLLIQDFSRISFLYLNSSQTSQTQLIHYQSYWSYGKFAFPNHKGMQYSILLHRMYALKVNGI
jgi:hypothetical protein